MKGFIHRKRNRVPRKKLNFKTNKEDLFIEVGRLDSKNKGNKLLTYTLCHQLYLYLFNERRPVEDWICLRSSIIE